MLITDTGVPEQHIKTDRWGAETMARLADGWCSALDRSTMMCTIYDNRPWICREFEMGARECQNERKRASARGGAQVERVCVSRRRNVHEVESARRG